MYGTGSMLLASLESTDGGTRYLIFGAILLPAVIMALIRSTWLVDYYFLVVCTNRLIRRFLDWNDGQYDFRPISSLTPMIIALLMLSVAIINYQTISKENRKFGAVLIGVLILGCLLGIRNGLGMIYSFLDYSTPLAILAYALWLQADLNVLVRWLRNISVLACGVAAYAWFQWVEMPPWDAFWIEQSGMWTSMGVVQSYRTAAFGTLESRGPFAWFMATVAIPLILVPRSRSYVNWFGVILIVSSILPSTVRSAFGIILLAMIGYVLTRGIAKSLYLVFFMALILGAMIAIRQTLPQSEYMFERLESVTELSQDSSFQGRVEQAQIGFGTALSNPFGFGLGSSGLGTMVSGQSSLVFDNGYLEILSTFGVFGAGVGFIIAFYISKKIYAFARSYDDDAAYLLIAFFFSSLGALLFSNWVLMSCSSIGVLCLAVAIVSMEKKHSESFDDDMGFEESDEYRLDQEGIWAE
jgi:putative inorganic carbon (HCO3(-)) transporter